MENEFDFDDGRELDEWEPEDEWVRWRLPPATPTVPPKLENTAWVQNFLRVVRDYYSGDPTSAGLVLSCLSGGQYYAAVLRYHGSFGKGKEVVCSAKGVNLFQALLGLREMWLADKPGLKTTLRLAVREAQSKDLENLRARIGVLAAEVLGMQLRASIYKAALEKISKRCLRTAADDPLSIVINTIALKALKAGEPKKEQEGAKKRAGRKRSEKRAGGTGIKS